MKTPDEIKRGLECCIYSEFECSDECPYAADAPNCSKQMLADVCAQFAKVPKWISVEERLPENDRMVIGFTPCDGFMFVGFYHEEKTAGYEWKKWKIITAMRSTKDVVKKVTHWMPLPPSPQEVK